MQYKLIVTGFLVHDLTNQDRFFDAGEGKRRMRTATEIIAPCLFTLQSRSDQNVFQAEHKCVCVFCPLCPSTLLLLLFKNLDLRNLNNGRKSLVKNLQ